MNEEKHWDTIGSKYNEEIFDVFRSDKQKKLSRLFEKYSDSAHLAIDFGCGTGKSFQHLAPLFGSILAVDISSALLEIAQATPYTNISFTHADLTQGNLKLPRGDFAFCCNVVMLPVAEQNEAMFRNIRRSLKKGGHAVFVLPAFESVLLATKRLMDWFRKEKIEPRDIADDELGYYKGSKRDIIQGLVQIDGVVTKHYTEPEITILFREAGFEVTSIERLEYGWDSEFASPPKWMKAPYPWDWLVEARKP